MVLEIEYTTAAVELQTPKFSAMAMVFVGAKVPILGISVQGGFSVTEILRQSTSANPPACVCGVIRHNAGGKKCDL